MIYCIHAPQVLLPPAGRWRVGGAMKDNSYVVIQSFMLKDLGLKGNELIIYAVIFGYTQDGDHWYYGTRGHLAEWCGASKGTVSNCLASLVEKGYISRREVQRPGYIEVQYQANFDAPLPKIDRGANKNCDTPLSKIDSINIKEDNKGYKRESGKKKEEYPKIIRCECGGDMVKTAYSQTATGRPYYRCVVCQKEEVYRG